MTTKKPIERKIAAFFENNDVNNIQLTLTEIALRDCSNNPIVYRETDIIEQVLSVQSFLQQLEKGN